METIFSIIKSQLSGISIGVGITIACGILIFIVKKTKTKKDDEFLKKATNILPLIQKGLDFAIKEIPAGRTVNALKLADNAIEAFENLYKEVNTTDLDISTQQVAKIIIAELAKQRAADNVKK